MRLLRGDRAQCVQQPEGLRVPLAGPVECRLKRGTLDLAVMLDALQLGRVLGLGELRRVRGLGLYREDALGRVLARAHRVGGWGRAPSTRYSGEQQPRPALFQSQRQGLRPR